MTLLIICGHWCFACLESIGLCLGFGFASLLEIFGKGALVAIILLTYGGDSIMHHVDYLVRMQLAYIQSPWRLTDFFYALCIIGWLL